MSIEYYTKTRGRVTEYKIVDNTVWRKSYTFRSNGVWVLSNWSASSVRCNPALFKAGIDLENK